MTDEQVLCKELGWFHNASFKEPGELWDLLMYMTGREDWANFYSAADFKYTTTFEWGIGEHCFIQWLLTATYTDKGKEKLLLVKLCADWCREHPGSGRIQEK